MERDLKKRMDVVDEIEDCKAVIAFMSHATIELFESDCLPSRGGEIIVGMQTIFTQIHDRVAAVSEAIQNNFRDTEEISKYCSGLRVEIKKAS